MSDDLQEVQVEIRKIRNAALQNSSIVLQCLLLAIDKFLDVSVQDFLEDLQCFAIES